ncbi:MAG: acylphosphatase [Exilibacterium sp.]
MICRYGVISGRVQGVGFRYFVRQCANEAGVGGWANNLPDGCVEVLLCGETTAVEQVQSQVIQGPRQARVMAAIWEERPYTETCGFSIG